MLLPLAAVPQHGVGQNGQLPHHRGDRDDIDAFPASDEQVGKRFAKGTARLSRTGVSRAATKIAVAAVSNACRLAQRLRGAGESAAGIFEENACFRRGIDKAKCIE